MQNKRLIENLKFCLLFTIELIVCFTPLGSIQLLGPIVATTAMIPIIITSICLGPKKGSLFGFLTGIVIMLIWTFMPPNPVFAFVFSPFYQLGEYKGNFCSLIIVLLPKILVGFFPGLIVQKLHFNVKFEQILASLVGSLTNTFLTLFLIFLFFRVEYEILNNLKISHILATLLVTNGIPEAIISVIICPIISNILIKYNEKNI